VKSKARLTKPLYKVRFVQILCYVEVYIVKNISKRHLVTPHRTIRIDGIDVGSEQGPINTVYLYIDKYFVGSTVDEDGDRIGFTTSLDNFIETMNVDALTILSTDQRAAIICAVISKEEDEPNALYIQYLKDYLLRLCDEYNESGEVCSNE